MNVMEHRSLSGRCKFVIEGNGDLVLKAELRKSLNRAAFSAGVVAGGDSRKTVRRRSICLEKLFMYEYNLEFLEQAKSLTIVYSYLDLASSILLWAEASATVSLLHVLGEFGLLTFLREPSLFRL